MVSFITPPVVHFHFSHFPLSHPLQRNHRSNPLIIRCLDLLNTRKHSLFGTCGFVLKCRNKWESEGGFGLEAEILEFMKSSRNPESFPSKQELVDAGRFDLVEGIIEEGGWMLLGWDLDSEDTEKRGMGEVYTDEGLQWSLSNSTTYRDRVSEDFSLPSSSGRSIETAEVDDSGIEGILSRLEKERNVNFGFGTDIRSNNPKHELLGKTSNNSEVAGLTRHDTPVSFNKIIGQVNDSDCELIISNSFSNSGSSDNSLKSDAWRSWSIQRAGFSDMEFEPGEIGTNGTIGSGSELDSLGDDTLMSGEVAGASLQGRKDEVSSSSEGINQIKSRLQHLGSELSSVLRTLKSDTGARIPDKELERSSDELAKLSDAWEFQESEVMNAQDKLRSLRAQLAVLEGKMAMARIDAQKVFEEKQKRIDDANRALQHLRTACIVWPNAASEVLLAGSFDGWTTQRKMEKSKTGVFSLYLKLYPGRYEIKFIVDGEWRIDPLRPVVKNYGFENNLFIVE